VTNKILKIFSALLLSVWLVGMYRAKFGQDTLAQAAPDVIVLGTDAEHPPYSFMENGQVVGFDVDLFSAVATRIGKKRIVKKLSPDQLMPQLSDEMVHAIAQETVTELDGKAFLVSHPYLEQNAQHFFVLSRNNEAFLALLNNALDEIKEDGTLVALQKKWNLIS
jgi:ABC-type amino acid transport substrate-binding protein